MADRSVFAVKRPGIRKGRILLFRTMGVIPFGIGRDAGQTERPTFSGPKTPPVMQLGSDTLDMCLRMILVKAQ